MKAWYKSEQNQVLVLVSGLIIVAFVIQLGSILFMQKSIDEAILPLDKSDSYQGSLIKSCKQVEHKKVMVLKTQYEICQKMKEYKKGVAVSYYVYYYSFLMCSVVFTTLLTIGGIIMANKGWQNSGIVLKAYLMTCIGISSIFYFLPIVLKNDENIKNCAGKVQAFENTQLKILDVYNRHQNLNDSVMNAKISEFYTEIGSNFDFITNIDNSSFQNPKEQFDKMNLVH